MSVSISFSFESLSDSEKAAFLRLTHQRRKWSVIADLVRRTNAVREGFLFRLPEQVLKILKNDPCWELARKAALESFRAESPERKAERLASAERLGQWDYLADLVRFTDCVEQGYLCDRLRGVQDPGVEQRRALGVERAMDSFRALSEWGKVCRIEQAVAWSQWGFWGALILKTDCVLKGLLWDPPPVLVSRKVRRLGAVSTRLKLPTDHDGSAVEKAWLRSIHAWRAQFWKASPGEQVLTLEKLSVLKQWGPIADVLCTAHQRVLKGTKAPRKLDYRGVTNRSFCEGITWVKGVKFLAPALVRQAAVLELWLVASAQLAVDGEDGPAGEMAGELFAYRLQSAREEAYRCLGQRVLVAERADSEDGAAEVCPFASLTPSTLSMGKDALEIAARSSGFRTALRGAKRVPPQKIPPGLRVDAEVVLDDWRATWGLAGESVPRAAENSRRLRAHRLQGGVWREGDSGDLPEERSAWAWEWIQRVTASRQKEVPGVPPQLRHIPQIFRLVTGWLLERVDTPINRKVRGFPDPAPYHDLLLNAGLWDGFGRRCAALVEWVYAERTEIRRLPALIRNHRSVLALCTQGMVYLEPAVAGDAEELARCLQREPVPWCLIPRALRTCDRVLKAFFSGWSHHLKRAVPSAALPDEAWEGDRSFRVRWHRAWRDAVRAECIPKYVIPEAVWTGDDSVRRNMWEKWFTEVMGEDAESPPDSDAELERWYLAWSAGWMLQPRSAESYERGITRCRVSVFTAGNIRVKLTHPDDCVRREALHWQGEFSRGDRHLRLLPAHLYHVSSVVDAWVTGRVKWWEDQVRHGGMRRDALLREWHDLPKPWIHELCRRYSLRKRLIDLCVGGREEWRSSPLEIALVPVWLRAHQAWESVAARGGVSWPAQWLTASRENTPQWLRENPVAPGVLFKSGVEETEPLLQACKEGWLATARKEAFPVDALPDFRSASARGQASDAWWKEAVSEGWMRTVTEGRDRLPWNCFPEALRDPKPSSPHDTDRNTQAARHTVQEAFERGWLRWAQSEEWLAGEAGWESIEASFGPSAVRAVFSRWRRAWSFSLSNQLNFVQRNGFRGYSLARVNRLLGVGPERASGGSRREKEGRLLKEGGGRFEEALFASWVWVTGAPMNQLEQDPPFLKNRALRELHLEGWRRVLETRAWAPEKVPPYVLRRDPLREAWRRGWCVRLRRECVSAAALPPELFGDEAVRAAWVSGWEAGLEYTPVSAWEIPAEIRHETTIRAAWRKAWVDRFKSGAESRELAVLVRHFFSPEGLPVHRRLWVVAVAGREDLNAVGVPRGYEAAEEDVARAAREWAEGFLQRGDWDPGSHVGLEMTPELFVVLCTEKRTVPSWENLALHLRRDPRVQQAWIRRHRLESRWAYALERFAEAQEADATGNIRAALEALFERPWAEGDLSAAARESAEVRRVVREGWEEKIRGSAAYRELHKAAHAQRAGGAPSETP